MSVENDTVDVVLLRVIGGAVALAVEEVGEVRSEFTAIIAKFVKHVVTGVAFKVFNRVEPLVIEEENVGLHRAPYEVKQISKCSTDSGYEVLYSHFFDKQNIYIEPFNI